MIARMYSIVCVMLLLTYSLPVPFLGAQVPDDSVEIALPPIEAETGSAPTNGVPIDAALLSGPLSSKITLELKGVDILDVLKVLSKKSGMNIVAGKNVRGQVTLFLQDVDVWDALKIVLETSDLAYEKKGDIIKVVTKADYETVYGIQYEDSKVTENVQLLYAKAQAVSDTLNQIKSSVGKVIVEEATNSLILVDTPDVIARMKSAIKIIDTPMETTIFNLKYATAEDLETKLSELVTPNVGTLKIDKRTNKIIVTDIASKLAQIKDIVRAFDEKPRQVLIEAKVIEIVLDDEYALGVNWNMVFKRTSVSPITYNNNTVGGLKIPNSSGPLNGLSSSNFSSFAINSSTDEFNAVFNALEGMGKTNTLSNPRIVVINNEESKIAVATQQPFVSQTVVQGDTTSTTADNVQFVDVGVTLTVKPTITDDNFILMTVKPAVSTAGDPLTLYGTDSNSNQYTRTVVPIVTSQEVETKVLVKSGNTIILGGLIQDSQISSQRKVPVLGDIPWVGSAFRSKTDDFEKTELIVFITPHILSPEKEAPEVERFYDNEGHQRGFNELGLSDSEYEKSSKKSQPYLRVNEEPFWEDSKRHTYATSAYEDDIDASGYLQRRDAAEQHALENISKSIEHAQVGDDPYIITLKKNMIDAIKKDSTVAGLTGEIIVHVIMARNGLIRNLSLNCVENPSRNGDVVLAINNAGPYPAFSSEVREEEKNLQFSLFL